MTELTDEAVKAMMDGLDLDLSGVNKGAPLLNAMRDLARALLDARAERDRLRADAQAANGVWQANLRLQAELADTQTQLGDWIVRADGANVMAEKAEAELAAAQQREARLLAAIEEATDPDFILGAMDNVNDMDVTLDGFAQAASRAIRAALAHNGRGE